MFWKSPIKMGESDNEEDDSDSPRRRRRRKRWSMWERAHPDVMANRAHADVMPHDILK